jgi:chemotaxis protein MotA
MRLISFSTIAGILLGFGLFAYAIVDNTDQYFIFWSLPSLLMVFGGTVAATMISYEGRYVWKAMGTLLQVIVPTRVNPQVLYAEVEQIISWGRVGAKEGVPGLEEAFRKVEDSSDPFLKHCIQLFLAGYQDENLKEKLETTVSTAYERELVQSSILNTMANIAPGFGMIGTLVGLIIMLSELDGGASNLGQGLAVALITTLYGVILAQLIFKPASRRSEQKSQIMRFRNRLIVNGFLLLVKRANSFEIQDHLNSFLDPAIRFKSAKKEDN